MTPSSVSRTMKAIGALVPVLYLCGILAACVLPNILANKTMPEAALSERLSDILREVRSQMVRVEGGSFAMGCTPEQEKCNPDESPVRRVQVASFEIGRYEVTQELWQAIMGENPSAFGDCPQCPGRDGELGRYPDVSSETERRRRDLSTAKRGRVGICVARRAAEPGPPACRKRQLG